MSTIITFHKFSTNDGVKFISTTTFNTIDRAEKYILGVYPEARYIGMAIKSINGQQYRNLDIINDAF